MAAYKTGGALLGEPVKPAAAEALAEAAIEHPLGAPGWAERAQAIGKPLLLGLAVFAVLGGFAAWALVHLAWTIGVRLKRRKRRRRH